MNNLVPESAWSNKEFVFIEPTCGNGQFLTRIFSKKIASGLSIEESLNTIIGMDITEDNIWDSHTRLFELACLEMAKNGIKKGSKKWFELAIRIVAIVRNNIFLVHDSLDVMQKYGIDSSLFVPIVDVTNSGNIRKDTNGNTLFKKDSKGNLRWVEKFFVFTDPTGNNEVMTTKNRETQIANIKKAFREHKDGKSTRTLAPFFA
jgi:hypothetical protein